MDVIKSTSNILPSVFGKSHSAIGTDELKNWIASLESQRQSVGKRNWYLAIVLAVVLLLLFGLLWYLYDMGVRSYAVLEDVTITRHPTNQGRVEVAFHVTSPGKVFYRRTCGSAATEVVDYFHETGIHHRRWSWIYDPGEDIDV